MDSLKDTQRQIRIAVFGVLTVTAIGTGGYMLIEGKDFLNALWLTIITLTTVGYGDDYASSRLGRVFTIVLIITGFGVVAYGLQAIATVLVSPQIRELRLRRHTERAVRNLDRHYIICGGGDLVDQTIDYLLQSVQMHLAFYDEEIYAPIDNFLDNIFGDDEDGYYPRTRALVRRIYLAFTRPFQQVGTLLDTIVIITEDQDYARKLREDGFLVIEGTPTRDEVLQAAGIDRAIAIMVMLPDDTEALLTVLSARSLNPKLYITATTIEQEIADKTLRVGANNVIRPYDLSGQYLNNVTLRPTVYDFFHGILFDQTLNIQTIQVTLDTGAHWIGKRLSDLPLATYNARILAIHQPNTENYVISPGGNVILSEGETLIIALPSHAVSEIQVVARAGTQYKPSLAWQRIRQHREPKQSSHRYTLATAQDAIKQMTDHFIVCGDDQVGRSAIQQLDPERPFVIISDNEADATHYTERGFRVIYGDPTHDETLLAAGVDRAMAIMISLHNEADTVLSVLTARALNERILITTTANSDEHIRKITHAGADRAMMPSLIAAQFVLLSTTRPLVSQFFQNVLYNPDVGLETTEIHMENSSAWIGQTIADLGISQRFNARIIGLGHANGHFDYAPYASYQIRQNDVLIIVTPMPHADELRLIANGSTTKQPNTLRASNNASG